MAVHERDVLEEVVERVRSALTLRHLVLSAPKLPQPRAQVRFLPGAPRNRAETWAAPLASERRSASWRLSGERRPCCWTLSRRALDDFHGGLGDRDGFGRRDDRGRPSRAGRRPRPGRGRRYRRRRDLAGVRRPALRRVGIDPEHDVEADALAGLQARDREAAFAADATQPTVGAHEGHLTWDLIAGPKVAGGETAAVADREPEARAATGGHRRAVSRLLDRHVAPWRTRAVTRSDTHVVEQVATTEEGRGPRHAGAELQAVDGRGRIAVRRWCLLRSGAVVVLPRREALTKVHDRRQRFAPGRCPGPG